MIKLTIGLETGDGISPWSGVWKSAALKFGGIVR